MALCRHMSAVKVGPLTDFSPEQMTRFAELVARGDEVDSVRLVQRIKSQGQWLACYVVEERLIGVGAVKRPLATYRTKVSAGSGVDLRQEDYPFELGWIFVDETFRRKGLSRAMCEALLALVSDSGIFATTRIDNEAMGRSLERLGFGRAGTPYKSLRGQYSLQLWLRPLNITKASA